MAAGPTPLLLLLLLALLAGLLAAPLVEARNSREHALRFRRGVWVVVFNLECVLNMKYLAVI